MACQIALTLPLSNLNDVFHMSQFRRCIPDMSHVIQVDDVQVRDNLIIEASPKHMKYQEVKQLRGKEHNLGA